MPIFLFDKVFSIAARNTKAFLGLDGVVMRSALLDAKRGEDQAENPKKARQRMFGQTEGFKSKKREISRLKNELRAAKKRAGRSKRLKRIKSKK